MRLFSQPVLKVLRVLDLGENDIGNDGIQVIREPLMMNRTLLQLGLAKANITCEGKKINTNIGKVLLKAK